MQALKYPLYICMCYFSITIVLVYIQEQPQCLDLDFKKGPKRFKEDSHVVVYGQVAEAKQ